MTAIAHLEIDTVEKTLLAAGLWSVVGEVPPELAVSREDLGSPEIRSRLLVRALEDKMIPMVLRFARDRDLELPAEIDAVTELYRAKHKALFEDLGPLVDAFDDQGIEVILLKGADLVLSAYPEDLPRMTADLDLLVKPTDLQAATRVFQACGYTQARIDMATLKLTPLSDSENQAIAENHYELAPFVRIRKLDGLGSLGDVIESHLKDRFFTVLGDDVFFAEGYDLHFNVSDNIDVADVWKAPRTLVLPTGQRILAQSATAMTWFLVARAYHEVMMSNQASIRHFIDILALLKAHGGSIDWTWLLHIAQKYALHPSMFYLFWHANELLGPVVPAEVIAACCPAGGTVSRSHDWGDPMPKLLGCAVLTSLLPPGDPALARP